MKKRVIFSVIGVVLLWGLIGFVSAFSGDGDGSLVTPYIITNCTQLQEMNESLAANYSLGNNINCSDTINWNGGVGFIPVGVTALTSFSGYLNGQGNNITELYINRPSQAYVGLFGATKGPGGTGTMANVGLKDVNITGVQIVGALSGSGGYISNSFSTGSVKVGAGGTVGGLTGSGGGAIINSYSECNVISTAGGESSPAGGLIGNTWNVNNSYATGSVTGVNYVGGLVGIISSGYNITNSYATGSVTGVNYVGGLVGRIWHDAGVINSYATGNVSGAIGAGGLAGVVGFAGFAGYVTNSFATGNVSGTSNGGELAGAIVSGTVSDSYWYNRSDGLVCIGGGASDACDANGKNDISYFYTTTNAPMSVWDFATPVWYAWTNDFPKLSAPPIGILTASLVGMANATVIWGNNFTFTSNVSCSVLDCGNVSAYLDPQIVMNHANNSSVGNSSGKGIAGLIIGFGCIVLFLVLLKYTPYDKRMILAIIFGILFVWAAIEGIRLNGYVTGGLVPMNAGTPFYTTSTNPQTCLNMAVGDYCNNTWTVVANGSAAEYQFFVKYNSTAAGVGEINTSSVYITINVPPQVTIESPSATTYTISSIDINISLDEAGYCEYSLDSGVTNNTLTANSTNTGFTGTKSGLTNTAYTLKVYCNDSYGLRNDTETRAFTINVAAAAAAPTSGGGSGCAKGYHVVNRTCVKIEAPAPVANNLSEVANKENVSGGESNVPLPGAAPIDKTRLNLILIISGLVAVLVILSVIRIVRGRNMNIKRRKA